MAAVTRDALCCSDGCRDSDSEEFRRPQPSKVIDDDLVALAQSSDARGAGVVDDRKLHVDPKMLFVVDKIGEGAHGKVSTGSDGKTRFSNNWSNRLSACLFVLQDRDPATHVALVHS